MNSEFKIYTSPSNIALIKYMGKKSKDNTPLNASFSYTLEHLRTGVQLIPDSEDRWKPLEGKCWLPLNMSKTEQKRFLSFFKYIKQVFNLKNNYQVRSANNFPKNSGIASSASSFSALTKATYFQALEEKCLSPLSVEDQAQVSRQGSGSSGRSFFSPWCLWNENNSIQKVDLPLQNLIHDFIWIQEKEKSVSSSQAHERVQTSSLFEGRKIRASNRLKELLNSLKQKNWKKSYQIVQEEFEDMHTLFETSTPFFSYRTKETKEVLSWFTRFWQENQDGPLVTMDAGSTIHLLYREDQKYLRSKVYQTLPFKIFTPL